MIEFLTIISGTISGACFMAIGLRKKLPLFGTLLSPKVYEDLDATDKRLVLIGAIFFCFLLPLLSYICPNCFNLNPSKEVFTMQTISAENLFRRTAFSKSMRKVKSCFFDINHFLVKSKKFSNL